MMDVKKKINEIIQNSKNKSISVETKNIIELWSENGADFKYFENSEKPSWTEAFWKEESIFKTLFNKLDTSYILELACGTGRHSQKIIDKCEHLWLLDSSMGALNIAKKKFSGYKKVTFVHNPKGDGIPSVIKDNSLTSIFSYDAMVHFEFDCIFQYLKDSYRKLKPEGMALFHHSNYDKNPGGTINENPNWRNFMNQNLFEHLSKRAGLELVESKIINWSNQEIDCITLLKKNK